MLIIKIEDLILIVFCFFNLDTLFSQWKIYHIENYSTMKFIIELKIIKNTPIICIKNIYINDDKISYAIKYLYSEKSIYKLSIPMKALKHLWIEMSKNKVWLMRWKSTFFLYDKLNLFQEKF